MAETLKVYGGVFDGATVTTSLAQSFLWVAKDRAYTQPGKGRQLYVKRRSPAGGKMLHFAGYTHRLCVCGTYCKVEGKVCNTCGRTLTARAS